MDNSRATYACSQAYALFNYSSTILFLPPNKERHSWKFSHHPRLSQSPRLPKPHLL
jgi:hypothetical protein